jgi:Sulfotransferase domain
METKKNIIWLASYPKSGNTWFRSFLTALFSEKELDINKLETNGIFSSKMPLENTLDLNADYLSPHQLEQYQRLAHTYLSNKAKKPLFIKIHDAFTFSDNDNLPLIPESPTKIAIYLVRNPLDVTLSLANHTGKSIEKTINTFITNAKGAFGSQKSSPHLQFRQPLGTWSMHAESWLNHPNFPVYVVRYEDMKAQPFETFKAAVQAMKLDFTDEQIKKAIEETTFEKLKKKEQENGFKEKPVHNSSFFHKGLVGRWKEELTAEQIEKIRNTNEPMMRYFHYWE